MALKNLLFCCLFLTAINSLSYAQASLSFAVKAHDFGLIQEDGGKVQVAFSFKNEGEDSLTIAEVKTSCGCTAPSWPTKAIAPGDTGSILVTYNPLYRPGAFEKEITVLLTDESETVLSIRGEVIPRPKGLHDDYPYAIGKLWFKEGTLFPASFYTYHDTTFTLHSSVYNASDKAIEINWEESMIPDFIQMNTGGLQSIPAKDSLQFTLTYDVRKRHDWGPVSDTILLATSDPEEPHKVLRVATVIQERFAEEGPHPAADLDTTRYHLGEIKPASTQTLSIPLRNTGSAPLHIRKVLNHDQNLAISYPQESIPPGDSGLIQVNLSTPSPEGRLLKVFSIITNDPAQSTLRFLIQAEVVAEHD